MKKIYAMAAALALPILAMGRPASPELLQHVNPDGTTVDYRIYGNEHFNCYVDADNVTILEINDKGEMVPKKLNGQTLFLNDRNIELLSKDFNGTGKAEYSPKGQRMAALDMQGRSTYPTVGEVHSLVVLLEFPDIPFSMADPVKQYDRFCNEEGYSDYGGRGSAKDYYIATSNGKFTPTFDVVGPVKLQHEHQWYVGMGEGPDNKDDDPSLPQYKHNARFGCAIKEALEYLDDKIEFSKYDYDKDGVIDNIFFFYSGYGQADASSIYGATKVKELTWPHQYDYLAYTADYGNPLGLPRLFVDEVEMRTYACSNELNGSGSIPASQRPYLDGIGAFTHEFGHVLGLPDLYTTRTGVATKTPGSYSVMDYGSYNNNSTCPPLFSSYEQWVCNWLDYTNAENGTTYSLKPLSSSERSAVRHRIYKSGGTYYSEYFLIEYRDKAGWDEYLPQHGMIIWRINYDRNAWVNNQVNVNGNPRIEIITQPGNSTQFTWPGETGKTYILPDEKVFMPTVVNRNQDVTISAIHYDMEGDNVLTFIYNGDKETNIATVMNDKPTADEATHTVFLRWQKHPEATNYSLTVSREAGGKTFYIQDLNETPVGNVDHYEIKDISNALWDQTYTAYVRVHRNIPSTEISNKITFVPKDLEQDSGVDGIDADNVIIYGGKGCVIAPAGARIFNLNGIETGNENLPAGIYIVVSGSTTAKVIVF